MLPAVVVQATSTSAVSPVAVKPTATKSWLWSGVRVTVLGETTSRLTVGRGSEIASSQPTKAAAAGTTATATTAQALSRARRRASLFNVIVPSLGDRSVGRTTVRVQPNRRLVVR